MFVVEEMLWRIIKREDMEAIWQGGVCE